MTKLTQVERQTIQGILDSDFMDGAGGQGAVGKAVWSWSANPFESNPRMFSGAVSSLVQKGYVTADDASVPARDRTIALTQAGFNAYHQEETTMSDNTRISKSIDQMNGPELVAEY